jgi:nucleotidyltransferase/DNA polymerase involved in DNA repair
LKGISQYLPKKDHIFEEEEEKNRMLSRVGRRARLLVLGPSCNVPRGFASKTAPPHQLNVNLALVKKEEGDNFSNLVKHPVMTLQGIGPKHSEQLQALGITTIQQLADYKFFHLAKSIQILSKVEEDDGRMEGSIMNLNKGLDKEFEHYSLKDLVEQPVHALQGLTPAAGETFQSMGVKTIGDLAEFKYCKWAEAIVSAAKLEEVMK